LQVPDSAPVAPGGIERTEEDIEYEPDARPDTVTADKDKGDTATPPAPTADTGDTSKEVDDTSSADVPERTTKSPPKNKDKIKGDKKPKRKKKKQGRFGTYVYYKDPDEDVDETESDVEKIRNIDRAGIDLVLDFEREAGRTPKEMPHQHPGYDIKSFDEYGVVARYIEVKSTADDWGQRGVGLTHTQFEKAQELGKHYWLYVVERAESDDAQVYPVQDPANMVNRFYYDDGWRAVALLDEQSEASEKPRENTSKRRSIIDVKKS